MEIYQFEITSICNLSCNYCPQKHLRRPKYHMSKELFDKILNYPFMLNIACGHHFGEPLLHPDLLYIAEKCRDKGLFFGFSTNGELLTIPKLDDLIKAGLSWIKISFHTNYSINLFKKIKERYPLLPVLISELKELHDWAGQVDIEGKNRRIKTNKVIDQSKQIDCIFHKKNLAVIDSRGDILACCMDAHGTSDMGSVFNITKDSFMRMKNDSYFYLCESCHMKSADIEEEVRFYEEFARTAAAFIRWYR